MYICIVITYSRVQINRKVANPVHDQLNREKFPCPRSRRKIWFRETGLTVPSRVSLLILYTNAESGAYLIKRFFPMSAAVSICIYPHTPSGQSRLYRVTQLRTDGVHCREFVVSKLKSLLHCCCTYCGPVFSPRLMYVQA